LFFGHFWQVVPKLRRTRLCLGILRFRPGLIDLAASAWFIKGCQRLSGHRRRCGRVKVDAAVSIDLIGKAGHRPKP